MAQIGKPRLLVIGGTGFIGSHLLAATKDEWLVTSVSLNPPSPENFVSAVKYLHLDLNDFDSVKNSLNEPYDHIVNLGGYVDHTLFNHGGQNLINTQFYALQNLIRVLSVNSFRRFVHIGSSDEYGDMPAPQNESMREQPISPYAMAKTAGTHFLQMLGRSEGLPVVVLRLFLTYGPRQNNRRFLPQVIQACLQSREFPASEGDQLRDFCYVQDVVDAIILALLSDNVNGQVINIASGESVTIRFVIERVRGIIGGGRPKYGKIAYRTGESMSLYADIEKAKRLLGWYPRVPFEIGLKKTISSFVEKT